jgi:hypothetical protein
MVGVSKQEMLGGMEDGRQRGVEEGMVMVGVVGLALQWVLEEETGWWEWWILLARENWRRSRWIVEVGLPWQSWWGIVVQDVMVQILMMHACILKTGFIVRGIFILIDVRGRVVMGCGVGVWLLRVG